MDSQVNEKKLFKRNMLMFSAATIGRDFLYNFFNGFLLTFVLLTKNLTTAQFSAISIIIVLARIFDALNDPIMGGIIENTRSRFGKYKPWQLIGAVSTGVVIILLFNLPIYGWGFIGFLAVCYLMFSITFSMNDISYWGMMPTITSDAHERNTLTSVAQIFVGVGGGAAVGLVPILTTGNIGTAVFGSVPRAFGMLSIIAAVLMTGFQFFSLFGVKENQLLTPLQKAEKLKFKDIFKVILKNDQLLWAAVCLLIYSIGINAFNGGLSTMFIYFEFGYDGLLTVLFMVLSGGAGMLFTILFPALSKKFGRSKVLYVTTSLALVGFFLLMMFGLFIPNFGQFELNLLGFTFTLSGKFILFMVANVFTGLSGIYMIQTINMANAVEYNEYRTGERQESLIFSLRPLTNKMASALSQGVVSLVYLIAGVLAYTNKISEIENYYSSKASLTEEESAEKLSQISEILQSVPQHNKNVLIICMCMIPIVLGIVTMILYRKFFRLDEKKMIEINEAIKERKLAALAASNETSTESALADSTESASTEIVPDESTDDPSVSTEATPIGEPTDKE